MTSSIKREWFERYYPGILDTITDHKRHIQGVFPCEGDKLEQPFCYTIGHTQLGLPELIMTTGSPNIMNLLNVIGDMLIERGRAFDSGQLVRVHPEAKCQVKIVDVQDIATCKSDWTIQCGEFYKWIGRADPQGYRVQQVVLPDAEGRFPNDVGCALPWSNQLFL